MIRTQTKSNSRSVSLVPALALAFSLISCTTPDSKEKSQTEGTSVAETPATEPKVAIKTGAETSPETGAGSDGFMPACLNVIENDLRVEFDKTRLILKDGSKPHSLSLDDGEDVRCEKLRLIENAKRPSVEIVYLTRETGSSINIIERKMAVAEIRGGRWVANPIVIDRLFSEDNEVKTVPVVNVKWSEDKGAPILTRTDIASKESETIKP